MCPRGAAKPLRLAECRRKTSPTVPRMAPTAAGCYQGPARVTGTATATPAVPAPNKANTGWNRARTAP